MNPSLFTKSKLWRASFLVALLNTCDNKLSSMNFRNFSDLLITSVLYFQLMSWKLKTPIKDKGYQCRNFLWLPVEYLINAGLVICHRHTLQHLHCFPSLIPHPEAFNHIILNCRGCTVKTLPCIQWNSSTLPALPVPLEQLSIPALQSRGLFYQLSLIPMK